jgi:hypothetical protein
MSGNLYDVVIARGVESTGDPRTVIFDPIASGLTLEDAATVARAAPHIHGLDFAAYAPNDRNTTP